MNWWENIGVMTVLHSYRLVTAFLYRMQVRSPIAEDAWEKAGIDDVNDTAALDQPLTTRLVSARNRAIEAITTGSHFPLDRSRAIDAIADAVRAALGGVKI